MERSRRRKGPISQKALEHQDHGKKSPAIKRESCPERIDVPTLTNNSNSAHKAKKNREKLKGKKYPLRSSQNGVRVLRSMSTKVNKEAPPSSTAQPVIASEHKRKKKRRAKKAAKDEYLKIRKHVRYLLHRMAYEQNFVEAYASEGWKGLSLEKIRPEKELERAKSEIVKCKLRIRGQFQQLDSLISEGRLDESLFDSTGEIDSEDIYCAKCGSKELKKNNDIILCDGICDRGFHQNCLIPPLLNEDIPPGDEGWLCPGCDCKLDCIDFINELHGSDLSIEDSWEKVFMEVAALAAGDKQYDDLGLPSDDSEDDDYAPGCPAGDGKSDEGEHSEEESSEEDSSDESFTSEDPMVPTDGLASKNLEFPSDDSEDDDFDPAKKELKVKTQIEESSSDESSFTSDTDDLGEFFGSKEVLPSTKENLVDSVESSRRHTRDINKHTENDEVLSQLEQDIHPDNAPLIPARRNIERLDYQKLYEEAYGNASSDSNDDEDWLERNVKKVKNDTTRLASKDACMLDSHRHCGTVKGESTGLLEDTKLVSLDSLSEKTTQLSRRKAHKKLQSSGDNHVAQRCKDFPEQSASRNTSTKLNGLTDLNSEEGNNLSSGSRFFSASVSQKLRESFIENQYPSREKKESLANELGITPKQVDKWFANARHSFRFLPKEASQQEASTCNGITTMADNILIRSPIVDSETTPSTITQSVADKSTPISMESMAFNKRIDSQTYSESEQKNLQNKASPSTMVADVKETKETPIENIDKKQLVLRELRKRRRGK